MNSNIQQNQVPLVSVAMATFNGERFLASQLNSILQQDYQNLEIIIVDDASSDKTCQIIENFFDQDSRIRFLKNINNSGHIFTFEKAIQNTTGQFIALSDQDDFWEPDKISRQVEFLQSQPEIFLGYHDAVTIDANSVVHSKSLWTDYQIKLFRGNLLNEKSLYQTLAVRPKLHGCMMMFRSELKKNALPFAGKLFAHDWWLAFIASLWGKIDYLPGKFVRYRIHENNLCGLELDERLLKNTPISARYEKEAFQYLGMFEYCCEYQRELKIPVKILTFLHKHYVTYLKRSKMMKTSRRRTRLSHLIRPPWGLLSLKKLGRDIQIALKTRKKFYTG